MTTTIMKIITYKTFHCKLPKVSFQVVNLAVKYQRLLVTSGAWMTHTHGHIHRDNRTDVQTQIGLQANTQSGTKADICTCVSPSIMTYNYTLWHLITYWASLGKGKGAYTWYSTSSYWITTAETLRYGTCSQGISQFYLHTHTFIRNRNEPYLPLSSQPQLVLIYRPRRDGRLSRPWCTVAQAEIRTRNLSIANPALYHTATSAPRCSHTDGWMCKSAFSQLKTTL